MSGRPDRFTVAVNVICLFLLIGVSLYLALFWSSIPGQIPGHYNAAGEVDRWGSKGELLMLLALGWALYIGLTVLEHFPGLWNTGMQVTEQNRERVFRASRALLETQKLWIVATLSYLIFHSTRSRPLSPWFLPIFLMLGLGSLAVCLVWLFRIGHGSD